MHDELKIKARVMAAAMFARPVGQSGGRAPRAAEGRVWLPITWSPFGRRVGLGLSPGPQPHHLRAALAERGQVVAQVEYQFRRVVRVGQRADREAGHVQASRDPL
jgi:hypothetical protein